jgi:1-acyl-sn-glycerol-3-phosphate acyltransferase
LSPRPSGDGSDSGGDSGDGSDSGPVRDPGARPGDGVRAVVRLAQAAGPALRSERGLTIAPRVVVDRLRRSDEPSGATRPRSRVAVTPATVTLRLPRPGGFPLAAPTWPGTVPRPPVERHLGVDYDSAWARRTPARVARLLLNEGVTRPLVAAVATPTVDGLDRIAHLRGPAIFAANHASHVDTPLLLAVIPEPWRHRLAVAGAADYFFDTRVKATLFALTLNAVPIERHRVHRGSAQRLVDLVEGGWSLLIYPEGGRSPDGWAQAHNAGAAWLAARTGRPVVPVHIEGTRRILARHARRFTPGRTHVTFGRPLRADPDGARDLAGRLERAIGALADEQTTDWWTATQRAAAGTTPARTGPDAASPWRRSWSLGSEGRRRRTGPDRWPPDTRR